MKTQSTLKIAGKILLVLLCLSPLLILIGINIRYNHQDEMKQPIEVIAVDSATTIQYIPSEYIEIGSTEIEVTTYSITYKDSLGRINRGSVPSRPKLGPAQIIIKNGGIVWYKAVE